MKRSRPFYGLLLILVIGLGLLSRRLSFWLPDGVNTYLGDALWAAMIFTGFAFLFNRRNTAVIAAAAGLYCILTECSQLYQAAWINEVRETTAGGLVLGYGFLWSDLIAYAMGITACTMTELAAKKRSAFQ
ncbi:DUF2809 domain-containing protein [Bacillus mangrovi]|uniref:DUF2809 domain-containing protein n=1 Tax=Metabacillus mangrovi TaxID=1491830 RepID=A0A7X2S866_9BACI|nr:DUF2809 domain-containing protein [Metabacillus mangrovi]MTH54576.1 DUF2809 domain-containing protein [Metabacillus mangrovi]